MKKIELKNIDDEEFESLLTKIEKSFHITFGNNELADIKTFGELCERIKDKIQLEDSDDCTTQQAFYKLRNGIAELNRIDAKTISPDDYLNKFFPRRKRKKKIGELENYLGFELNLLQSPGWVTSSLLVLFLTSLVGLFFNFWFLTGLAISLIGFKIAHETGIELKVKTLGELSEKVTRENYVKARRNLSTFNKNEIDKILVDWFSDELDIKKENLVNEAVLNYR